MFFVLNEGELDTSKLAIVPALILDQNQLDINGLSSNAYDSLLAYDSELISYNGTFNWQISGISELQGLVATASSNITKIATALAALGSLNASADESIANFAHGSANLNTLQAIANAVIEKIITANSNFDQLNAQATVEIDNFTNATANLGSLTATAEGSIPTPPQPEPSQQLYGSNPYYKQKIQKKVKIEPKPKIKVIIESPKQFPPLIKTYFAKSNTNLTQITVKAESVIEFSILEDEAELLLLI